VNDPSSPELMASRSGGARRRPRPGDELLVGASSPGMSFGVEVLGVAQGEDTDGGEESKVKMLAMVWLCANKLP
jgi:hypothetical protein